jgi:hypothetical protein
MKISARSALMAGVTALTVTAVAAAPSVQPLPPSRPEIRLAAAVQSPPDEPGPHLLQILLTDPARLLGPAVPFGTLPPPPAPIQFAIAPNIADTIDGIYVAVEPWVEYGFLVASDVLGWVPWVGWLSGQIMVFYRFGEGMVASGVFNFTDWLRGDEGAIPNLVDFGLDVGRAFIWLGIDEWNYFLPPLPPLPIPRPPRPPAEGPFLATSLTDPTEASVEAANAAGDLVDAISTVPSVVTDSLKGLRSPIATEAVAGAPRGPLAEVTKAVGDVGKEIRGALNARTEESSAVRNGVVRAQGEVRDKVTKAVSDVTNTPRGGKPSKATEDAATAPTSVAKSVGDTARKVVKDVRQAAKEARNAAKDRPAADNDK